MTISEYLRDSDHNSIKLLTELNSRKLFDTKKNFPPEKYNKMGRLFNKADWKEMLSDLNMHKIQNKVFLMNIANHFGRIQK